MKIWVLNKAITKKTSMRLCCSLNKADVYAVWEELNNLQKRYKPRLGASTYYVTEFDTENALDIDYLEEIVPELLSEYEQD